MGNNKHPRDNYWNLLDASEAALAQGDFPAAERYYHLASRCREESPGRVFFTEKLGDGLRGLLNRRKSRAEVAAASPAGRWALRSDELLERFLAAGESVVREGLRLSELRPEDDAEHNQPILETALFLVAGSRIFQEEPSSAVPLLKGVFRTARRTARPFDVQLVRHDIPLTEEDRLWLARRGSEVLEIFLEHGRLEMGSAAAQDWARAVLQLLQPEYFGSSSRLQEERCWLEAVSSDRLLGKAPESVDLYRTYLQVNPEVGARADEARVRLLELLGNTDTIHFPVPRYREALGVMQSTGLSADSQLSARHQAATACIAYRRPEPDAVMAGSLAWASLAVEPDGRVAAVFWWDGEPRDLAFWRSGDDTGPIDEFLAPCEGRLVAVDATVNSGMLATWSATPGPWAVHDFILALLESSLPARGLSADTLLGLGLAETGPWRAGWDARVGHPDLEPPRSSSLPETWRQGPGSSALLGGLAWLAVRTGVVASDPTLRAGIGEMARRGDAAARFVYDFLTLDRSASLALDASFEPWMLPLLWTRPDPYGWSGAAHAGGPLAPDPGIRPDLVRNDLAIVSTGDPAPVLAAWAEGQSKMRLVLDRSDRLDSLAGVTGAAVGPVTMIPREGTVHSLAAALDLLEDLLQGNRTDQDAMIPLFHWLRLVETHNGDLMDFRQVRPRREEAIPLYDRYAELVRTLPREAPSLAVDDRRESWAGQFSQRVRKAGLVAGTVDQLVIVPADLDSLWGVFEGSDASWVFLDSAAVHWAVLNEGRIGIQELHAMLHSRGRRHLSLLTGAVWLRPQLEDLLSRWLGVFGTAYALSLTDQRPPLLKMADRGVHPHAEFLIAEALAGQATWVDRSFGENGGGTIVVPETGPSSGFWKAVQSGDIPLTGQGWRFLSGETYLPPEPDAGGFLAVPALASLDPEAAPLARGDARADWAQADRDREAFSAWRRHLCALEIGALMAGPWTTVGILDTRWWRLLMPAAGETQPPGDSAATPWNGELASHLATRGAARPFDLPGRASGDGNRLDTRIAALVDGWLNRQYRPLSLADGREGKAGFAGSDFRGGAHLVLGDDPEFWPRLNQVVAEAWERGQLNTWILVVADQAPPGAAAVIAASGTAGISVWMGDDPGASMPAPVVWVEPEDFLDPDLRAYLLEHRPDTVVAQDIQDWLPGPERDAQETALSLRTLLDCTAGTVVLMGRGLPASWTDFLAESCRAKIHRSRQPADADAAPAALFLPVGTPARPCLDAGHARHPAEVTRRLAGLLTSLRALVALPPTGGASETTEAPAPAENQLLPTLWLGQLAGLSVADVADGVRILRWAARLAGDSLSWAGSAATTVAHHQGGHTLLIPRRYADLENELALLEKNLGILLPLWLGQGLPGRQTWIDLETPPAAVDSGELALVDSFLAFAGAAADEATGLIYACPRGLIHSTQRIIGSTGPVEDLLMSLDRQLRIFKARLADVMASAQETGDGFKVVTGLVDLRPEEQSFLSLGVALGYWRWLGPAGEGTMQLVDLLTLADSPTAKNPSAGWSLLQDELADRYPQESASAKAIGPRAGTAAGSTRPRGGLRSLLNRGMESSDDLDPVVARVAGLAGGEDDATLLVLKGLLGTGRHAALARGILRVRHRTADPGEVTFYCPDEAVAAMLSRELLVHGLSGPLDIRVPLGTAALPLGQAGPVAKADPANALVVMCEAQRFDAETRYRIAQAGRGRRLLMTIDPAAMTEGWEHLFLTTPRASEIVELGVQRLIARRLWSEVRLLAPTEHQIKGGSRSGEKGVLVSDYAANLDQCLARVGLEFQEGKIRTPMRLTAPMPADLEYLGSSIRNRGWLAVLESRVESLLLPGPREFLAAVADHLALGGEPVPVFGAAGDPDPDAAAEVADAGAEQTAAHSQLLPHLLGTEGAADWRTWAAENPVAPETTLVEFAGLIASTPWANTFLSRPENRQRVRRLIDEWGSERLAALRGLPLLEAWYDLMTDDLQLSVPARQRRPLVVLTSAARPLGCRMKGGAYLCLGTEPDRQHYEALGRVNESLLVLYQERSPLPGESPD